jgi:hypothetical protein
MVPLKKGRSFLKSMYYGQGNASGCKIFSSPKSYNYYPGSHFFFKYKKTALKAS